MSNNAHDKAAQEEYFADIFARLREQDIEQFYAHYQLWVLRRRLPLIEKQLEALREHLAENQQVTESMRPSALALAVLVRLQSNGVNDTDVLDLMLDRGEDWLDRMMQRLDYCEQVEDFIQGDYTQWCIKSLEGAYDWIDSLLGSIKEENGHRASSANDSEATEALLLQKLSQDDEEAMLEVTLTSLVSPHEASADSHEISSAESLPIDGLEQIISSDEQISALDEPGGSSSQPELIRQSDEAVEPQENSELEQEPELIGWKDLEDLEAPGGQPVPWYSIDVTEDGTTSNPNGVEQAATMNDWIIILQADTSEAVRATEETTDDTAELRPTNNLAETTEIHTFVQSEAIELPKETANASTNLAEVSEAQNEPEVIFSVNPGQEESTPIHEDLQSAERSSDESEILLNETLDPGSGLAEEVILLPEKQASEATRDESIGEQAEVAENKRDAYETNAVTVNVEQAEEEVSHPAHENPKRLEELEQEADPQAKQREEAQTLAQEGVSTPTETESAEVQQSVAADLAHMEVEEAEIIEVPSSVADLETSENAPAELIEVQISSEETTERAWAGNDATDQQQQPTEADSLNLNVSEEQASRYEADHAREREKDAQGNEIEIAAIANDILSGEEEQEEQLAWYEYLDLEEPANSVESSTIEEDSAPEKSGNTTPVEPVASQIDVPETYLSVGLEKSSNEQNSLPRAENQFAEEAIESENWQSWNASEGDEETLPLALKEIQRAQMLQINDAQTSIVKDSLERSDIGANAEDEPHPSSASIKDDSAAEQMGGTEVEASSSVEEANMGAGSEKAAVLHMEVEANARVENLAIKNEQQPVGKAADITEQPTLMLNKIPLLLRESPPTGAIKGNADVKQAMPINNTPISTQFTQPGREEKPLKKPGFWRRLFSFGRKKK